jgi:hypothetical protein
LNSLVSITQIVSIVVTLPTLLDCTVSLTDSSGKRVDGNCTSSLSDPIYTNVLPIEIILSWEVAFQGPTPPSKPSYILGYGVGIVATHINATIRRAAALSFVVDSELFDCLGVSFSNSMPRAGPTSCSNTQPLLKTFHHGDRYETTVFVENGGYLLLRDHDLAVNVTEHYSGSQFMGHVLFVLDVLPPVHCSISKSIDCLSNQQILSVVSPITQKGEARIKWGGWLDELSSLDKYQIDVYPLQMKGNFQCEQLTDLISSTVFDAINATSFCYKVHLTNSGIYSIVMTVTDIAGNHRYSRRLFLYDSDSELEIDLTRPIHVTSAVNKTVNRWQTNLTELITFNGFGHFYNSKLRTNKWLDPVCDFERGIDPDYDQPLNTNLLPRSGTLNADGIVKLEYAVGVDHSGGSLVSSPTSWTELEDLSFSNFSTSVNRVDGDTAKFFFRATDYLGQEKTDSLLLNFDSSPPTVDEPWLLRNGQQLALHDSTDLLQMNIQVSTEDLHSGIARIEWTIGTSKYGNDVGNGRVPIIPKNKEDCDAALCYCIPTGLCFSKVFDITLNSANMRQLYGYHDTDYFIGVVVTNEAGLTNSSQFKMTIDMTPPQTGAVFDSKLGSKDIDYQSASTYHFHWDGFFDPETDVVIYQYIVDKTCSTAGNFSYPRSGKAIETNNAQGLWETTSPGKYFITVVAFNKVLVPSSPVCSDGITIDQTPPTLEHIFIENIVSQPGLIQDPQNQVWLVLSDRRIKMVISPSDECFNNSLPVSDISLYPLHQYKGVLSTVRAEECTNYQPFRQIVYLPQSGHIAANWTSSDSESGVLDYEVGLSSRDRNLPDIRGFESTGRYPFTATSDSKLHRGSHVYLIVKATNQALLSVTKRVGPIIIDTTPPLYTGQLNVKFLLNQLVVSWTDDAFQDPEDTNGVELQLAIGLSPKTTEVIDFCPIENCFKHNGSSVTIPVDSLSRPLHNGHTYYVFLQATNGASLRKIVSASYLHEVGLPSVGFVHDIEPKATDVSWWREKYGIYLDHEDIDFQTANSSIAAYWFGFVHDYLQVTYEFGVGSSPGLDDVVAFKSVGGQTMHTESDLVLQNLTLYVTIRASNAVGNVTATSDGVVVMGDFNDVIHDQQEMVVVDGNAIESDTDYQLSWSEMKATWRFPSSLKKYFSHYEWAIYERQPNGRSEVKSYHSVASRTSVTASGLTLKIGSEYFVAVKFCYASGCSNPVYSDGVQIVGVPTPSTVSAVYDTNTTVAVIQWGPFIDPRMSHYVWSIGTGSGGSQLVVPADTIKATNDTMITNVTVSMSAHYEAVATVSGYNAAGVAATVSVDVVWKENGRTVPRSDVNTYTLTIYDIAPDSVQQIKSSDWRQLEHASVSFVDIQYSGYSDRLAAAWPTLRYPSYFWSISELPRYVSCSLSAIACGETPANEVVSSNLELQHGHRYYFCVWSNATSIQHENFREDLPPIEVCSNGVTIDLEHPLAGCVWVGNEEMSHCQTSDMKKRQYQASTTEMVIFWSSFSDIEVEGTAVHVSGIAYYEYAIGSAAGLSDVVKFTNVGAATRALIHSLSLRDGEIYYVTVRAYDFVGLWTDAYSSPIVIDSSAPSIGIVTIGEYPSTATSHISSLSEVTVHWSQVEDPDSGIAHFQWGLGSFVGHVDMMPYTAAEANLIAKSTLPLKLSDGQLVFVTILATNKAGLSSISTSAGYVVDTLPPSPGYVFDGSKPNEFNVFGRDVDYGSSLTQVSAHWGGFSDYGTGIVEYQWTIESCPKCKDIITWHSVGLQTDGKYTQLSLLSGKTYYSSVKACDGAGFCSSIVTSDGLLVDDSPPIPGRVVNGIRGEDRQYQQDRYLVSAHWLGFHDPHSSLSYFEWSVGTSPNKDDVLAWKDVYLSENVTETPLNSPLPLNRLLYVSVRAVNMAGLTVTQWSNGFKVDTSPPAIVTEPKLDVTWAGSLAAGTQFDSSQVKANWQFQDLESDVTKHYWSIRSHGGAFIPHLPRIVAQGNSSTMTGLTLHDGDHYTLTVIACNGAALCTTAVSQPVLVDSTVPSVGTFAVDTESAAMVDRSVPGSMTWSNHPSQDRGGIDIAWLGFSDPHSSINRYQVSVSSGYARDELDVSDSPETVDHSATNRTQRAVIPVKRRLVINENILISIWALNTVGLRSEIVTDTFTVVPGPNDNPQFGTLSRQRSTPCQIHTCMGHCTCAAQGHYCQSQSPCVAYNSTAVSSDRQIVVSDVIQGNGAVDSDFTASTCCLSAVWSLVGSGSDILWYEWSAGRKGKPVGSGIFDTSTERHWFSVSTGSENLASLVLPSHRQLTVGVEYAFYIRVWYGANQYAIFESDGVTIDPQPPSIYSGHRVKEVTSRSGSFYDIDYTQSTSPIHVYWSGVFSPDTRSSIREWRICLGETTGVCTVYSDVLKTNSSVWTLPRLTLTPGIRYFSTVTAISPIGLETSSTSDGVLVDDEKPVTGMVLDGDGVSDVRAQRSTSSMSASWHGFRDLGSGIHHYEWAIGQTSGSDDIMGFKDVGLAQSARADDLNLTEGTKYYATVVAVDGVGIRSDAVSSDGVTIDSSRPCTYTCNRRSPNVVNNPSFEGNRSNSCSIDSPLAAILAGWTMEDSSWVRAVAAPAYDGCYSLYFFGAVRQKIMTKPGTEYRLHFHASSYNDTFSPSASISGTVAGVSIPTGVHTFAVNPTHHETGREQWNGYTFVFTATDKETDIMFSSMGRSGIMIDLVTVDYCMERRKEDAENITIINNSSSISIGARDYIGLSPSRIFATWDISEEESGIFRYWIALGTIAGGEQLQRYTSVDKSKFAVTSSLHLQHGCNVYVSVLTWNDAGKERVVRSKAFLVDLTHPQAADVTDGPIDGHDLDYQSTTNVSASWSQFTDPESGIDECKWAIGSSPHRDDIQGYRTVSGGWLNASRSGLSLSHGQRVYVQVVCTNGAGLSSLAVSDGVTILIIPPSSAAAALTVSATVPGEYEAEPNVLPQTDTLRLSWSGFVDGGSLLVYQVKVTGTGIFSNDSEASWTDVGHVKETLIAGLQLQDQASYTAHVRAVSLAGLVSEPVKRTFSIISRRPADTGNNTVRQY